MQVTDEMLAAAMRAFRLQPPDLNTSHPEGMYIDHHRMRDAVQAALDAMPKATGGLVTGPVPIPRAGCHGDGYMLPLKTPLTVPPGTTVTVALKVDPQNPTEVVVEDLRIDIRHGEPVNTPEVATDRPASITVPASMLDTDSFEDPTANAQAGKYWVLAQQQPETLDASDDDPTKLADYLVAAEIDAHIDVTQEDSVRADWWRASCAIHDWHTTGGRPNVEDAAAEHVEAEHRPCAARHPRRFINCHLLPDHEGDHMNHGETWTKKPEQPPTAPRSGSLGGPLGADYNPLKLMSPADIAEHLGVEQDAVDGWITQGHAIGFPSPHKQLQDGPRYLLSAIDEWHRTQRPQAADG